MYRKKVNVYHLQCAGCREEFDISDNPHLIDPSRMNYCPYCGSYTELVHISKK